MPLCFQPKLAVALQQGIGGDDHVVGVDVIGQSVPLFAMQYECAQLRTKACRFALPVSHQADRRDDEGGAVQTAGVFFDLDVHQGLQGFAEAHVVGKDAAEIVLT